MMQKEHNDKSENRATTGIGQSPSLHVIVGGESTSPCDHETYERFKLWVASTLTEGHIDTYRASCLSIMHWDDQASAQYPHLLNPCECCTFLPIDVEPGPMLASALGLLSDLHRLESLSTIIPAEFRRLIDALLKMAERSIATNTAMEIR